MVPNLPPPKVQKVDLAALFTARQLPMSDNECVSTSIIYIRSVSTQLLRDIKYVELVHYSCLMILNKFFVDFESFDSYTKRLYILITAMECKVIF